MRVESTAWASGILYGQSMAFFLVGLLLLVAQEVAVALVYNGISHAVMMATPCDLEDFARGFSLTERIVERPSEIYDIEVEPVGRGIEVRLNIAAKRMAGLQQRRRTLAGRTGCGLCGVDSLDELGPVVERLAGT